MFHIFSGNLQYALYETAVCSRMIYMLGAHTTTYPSCTDAAAISSNPAYRERYLLRNIFWVCYMLGKLPVSNILYLVVTILTFQDQELSIRTGQPPCLQHEHCDTTLPPPHVQQLYPQIMGYEIEPTYSELHLFPGHPWLSIIKAKAYCALYSVRALQKSDADLLHDIRQLDDDLEQWRLSIPVAFRPTLSFNQETLPPEATTMLSLMLHLDYNHCVAAIHQATSRCQAWKFGDDNDETAGVGTSLQLAIEASRSSLMYLQMAYHLVDDDCFWYGIPPPHLSCPHYSLP